MQRQRPHELVPLACAPRDVRHEEKQKKPGCWVAVGQFQLGETIGKGGFGKVRQAIHAPTGQEVVLKVFSDKRGNMDSVLHEVEMQAQCHAHPNIPTCYDVFQYKHKVYVAMQRATGRDLFEDVLANGPLPLEEAKAIVRVLMAALAHMHERNIAHRDVKPENVLLGDFPSQAMLCDFGFAVRWDKAKPAPRTAPRGTVRCLPPEAFVAVARKAYNPQAADVFGLGNVLFFMLTGEFPFEGADHDETAANIVRGTLVASFPPNLPAEADAFLCALLERDVNKRPTVSQLRSHEFLALGSKRSM